MTETVAYDVTGQIGEIEFRKYPQLVLATVHNPGDESGFSSLFAYITGNNHVRGKIPMTAPVITSQRIPMTAPVLSDEQSMSFVMPAGKTELEMPEPLDNRVQLSTLPAREIAVIRFKGYTRRDEVETVKARLLDCLKKCRDHNRGPAVVVTPQPSGCATTGTMRHGRPGSCGEMRSRLR